MDTPRLHTLIGLVVLAVAACAPTSASTSSGRDAPQAAPIQRLLVGGLRAESSTVALRPPGAGFTVNTLTNRIFNADLARIDDRGQPQPHLAEGLPQLGTENWKVLPDGRMEVTWRFRPSIVWQDGTPLSMQDFLFAWQMYRRPEYVSGTTQFAKVIREVAAPDEGTLVVSYRAPFPDALTDTLPPLPRHLLADAFERDEPSAFAHQPYWSTAYVGLGPWRLAHWEPGAFLEGAAFDQHVLGRPKIDRIRIVFIGDSNAALANTLAGEVHFSTAGTFISVEQGQELKRQWDQADGGTVALYGNSWRLAAFQFRPEFASPPGLLDARVRKALAYGVDKQAIVETIFGPGSGLAVDFFVQPDSIYGGPNLAAGVTKYAYDPGRVDPLMTEAGYVKGGDGIYANVDGRFQVKVETAVGREDMTIMASDWRKVGFDAQPSELPAALAQDAASRNLFSGLSLYTNPQISTIHVLHSSQCPKADSGYRVGENRGCWQNSEFDRISGAFATTLDPRERAAQVLAMARVYTQELPQIPLYLAPQVHFWVSGLAGIKIPGSDGDNNTNMWEWEWAR
ncbi:MAG TPA: ABC transporter substrate-binding protein [Chloroflexota bacterium]